MKKVKKDIDVQLEENKSLSKEVKHSFHEVISLIQDSDGFKIRIFASHFISQVNTSSIKKV